MVEQGQTKIFGRTPSLMNGSNLRCQVAKAAVKYLHHLIEFLQQPLEIGVPAAERETITAW
jgi:hypothetical protein